MGGEVDGVGGKFWEKLERENIGRPDEMEN